MQGYVEPDKHIKVFLCYGVICSNPAAVPGNKSSNNGSKYTFMFFPRYFGPGIIIDTNMFYRLMQTPGGGSRE
jgi:hypothetical protein